MLGSYNPLLIIVIICTVNLPQIKQTNKLKAQTSQLLIGWDRIEPVPTNPVAVISSCSYCNWIGWDRIEPAPAIGWDRFEPVPAYQVAAARLLCTARLFGTLE